MSRMNKNPLPPGVTETTLRFDVPGEIRVEQSTGGASITVNFEEIWDKLAFTAYDADALREWESVFLRLAQKCNEMRHRY